jgi:hypothetical protein
MKSESFKYAPDPLKYPMDGLTPQEFRDKIEREAMDRMLKIYTNRALKSLNKCYKMITDKDVYGQTHTK